MQFNFVAVNYNGAGLTIEYLRSIGALLREGEDIVRVVIVDNNSDARDRAQLEEYISDQDNTDLLSLHINVGYFGGLNAGLDFLADANGAAHSYTIVGNNDLTFSSDFIAELRNVALKQGWMVIAPDVVTLDGRHQNPLSRSRLSRWHKVSTDIYFVNYYFSQFVHLLMRPCRQLVKAIHKRFFSKRSSLASSGSAGIIKLGIGACYVLTPEYFKNFQKLDDRVFLWGEEVLLAHQVESASGVIVFCPSLKVTHCESASVSRIQSKVRYEMVKASYKVYRKYL